MKITAISDLHGFFPELLGGDLLIVAGDLTAKHSLTEWEQFRSWISTQNYRKKIVIAGNHDNFYEKPSVPTIVPEFTYLCDSGTEFEGLKIWGCPWTHRFKGINPKCTAFTYEDESWFYDEKLAEIPLDTDILITHGPAYGILDKTVRNEHVGSKSLYGYLKYVIRPKVHVCGHIHEAYGQKEVFATGKQTMMKSINCSHVNVKYQPVNEPITFEL